MLDQIFRIILKVTRTIARAVSHIAVAVVDWVDARLAAAPPTAAPIANDDWYTMEVDGTLEVGDDLGFRVVAGQDGRIVFGSPRDVAADSTGNVYVTDAIHHRVHKLDDRFDPLAQWGRTNLQSDPEPGTGPAEFDQPGGIAIEESGAGVLFVVDSGNDRIQLLDLNGNYIDSLGTSGTGPDQFDHPWGVAVDAEGRVYVTDHENHLVKTFTSSLLPDGQWGGSGIDHLLHPRGIAIGPDGFVYVVDAGNHRVRRFTRTGDPRGMFGAPGNADGQFDDPTDIAIDIHGDAYVVDRGNLRIQKFTSADGTFIDRWGEFGDGDNEFMAPHGVGTDRVGDVLVADAAPNMRLVQRLRVGVLGNDVDTDGDPLSAVLGAYGGTGDLKLNSDGSFRYSPAPQFTGADTFTYRAEDPTGGFDTATVTIDVAPNT